MRQFACYVIILILPLISRAILRTFRCDTFDEDNEPITLLFADTSFNCNSKKYRDMFVYALVNVLIWPIGVPLTLMVWLSKLSTDLDPPDVNEKEAIVKRLHNENLKSSAVAFMALRYKPRYWYYELIDLTRRLMLTCVTVTFEGRGPFLCFVVAVSIITTVNYLLNI